MAGTHGFKALVILQVGTQQFPVCTDHPEQVVEALCAVPDIDTGVLLKLRRDVEQALHPPRINPDVTAARWEAAPQEAPQADVPSPRR